MGERGERGGVPRPAPRGKRRWRTAGDPKWPRGAHPTEGTAVALSSLLLSALPLLVGGGSALSRSNPTRSIAMGAVAVREAPSGRSSQLPAVGGGGGGKSAGADEGGIHDAELDCRIAPAGAAMVLPERRWRPANGPEAVATDDRATGGVLVPSAGDRGASVEGLRAAVRAGEGGAAGRKGRTLPRRCDVVVGPEVGLGAPDGCGDGSWTGVSESAAARTDNPLASDRCSVSFR